MAYPVRDVAAASDGVSLPCPIAYRSGRIVAQMREIALGTIIARMSSIAFELFNSAVRTRELSPMSLLLFVRGWLCWNLSLPLTSAYVWQCSLVHSSGEQGSLLTDSDCSAV